MKKSFLKKLPLLAVAFIIFALICTGCARSSADSEMTQLQIREIQTRTFEAKEAKAVLKEMINVLQDEAFIVKNANMELGLLSGEKDIELEKGWEKWMTILASGQNARWTKNGVLEISANVTQFGADTRVRINVQRKVYDNFGRIVKVTQIYDPQYYQAFFEKVHKGLFIQEEKI
ncbi:MAG TPA: hypothetical protein VHK67_02260 [Rhabdochlamydiaceae bacterium]|jgi:hypothetical protein|nr:hypothetical protein [Rhabdochlamydiaceae bacterium]